MPITAAQYGSIPHTIEQAVDARVNRFISDAPIDVVAVVVAVETREKFARLWIHDASLSPGQRAQVIFLGKVKRNSIVDEQKIRSGDVIRFNRIELRINQHEVASNVFVFWHSVQDPEAGAEFFRLCHVDGASGQVDRTPETDIPSSIQTNRAYVDELISWYTGSELFGQSAALPTLPCQFRTLAEFQSCLGVVGHAIARVIQVEIRTTAHRRRKRKDAIATEPTSTVVANLMDEGTAQPVTFYFDNSTSEHTKFRRVLEQARDEKRYVRLSRVVAKSASRRLATSKQNDEILLLPTSHSDVTLAEIEEINQFIRRGKDMLIQTQDSVSTTNLVPMVKDILDKRSPILDITVKGVSIARKCTEFLDNDDASSNLHTVLRSDDEYSCATIKLLDHRLGEFNVEADGDIVKILCGGLALADWSPARFVERKMLAYNQIVHDMIRGLLHGNVELRWEIERIAKHSGRTSYRVLAVSLPEF